MKPPDKKKMEEFKKQFQTSNFSANEYMKWKRSGQPRDRETAWVSESAWDQHHQETRMGLEINRQNIESDKENASASYNIHSF